MLYECNSHSNSRLPPPWSQHNSNKPSVSTCRPSTTILIPTQWLLALRDNMMLWDLVKTNHHSLTTRRVMVQQRLGCSINHRISQRHLFRQPIDATCCSSSRIPSYITSSSSWLLSRMHTRHRFQPARQSSSSTWTMARPVATMMLESKTNQAQATFRALVSVLCSSRYSSSRTLLLQLLRCNSTA